MKVRSGFVSNSSSSSFVLVGLDLTGEMEPDELEEHEQYDDDKMKLAGIDVFFGADDQVFVGEGAYGEENMGAPDFSMGLGRINRLHDMMKKKLEPLGLWDENGFGVHSGYIPIP